MINTISFALSGLFGAAKKAAVAADNIVKADSDVTPARNGSKNSIILRTPATMAGYDPDAPYQNSEGYAVKTNVNISEELTHLEEAQQAYTANAVVIARVNALKEALRHNGQLSFVDQQA